MWRILLIKSPKVTVERSAVEICSSQVTFMNLNSTIFRSRELLSNAACAPTSEKPLSAISAQNGRFHALRQESEAPQKAVMVVGFAAAMMIGTQDRSDRSI